jgi:hypothetical protein
MGAGKSTWIVQWVAVCMALSGMGTAHAAGTFDGDWNVTLTCPKVAGGVSGYRYQFPAEIQENVLHGEHGVRDAAGWLTLDGKLEPDGSATLVAQGLTSSAPYAPGQAYTYDVSAQFDATTGSGSRATTRKCDVVFAKQ